MFAPVTRDGDGHDLRQHIHVIRAALGHLESTETVFANQWATIGGRSAAPCRECAVKCRFDDIAGGFLLN